MFTHLILNDLPHVPEKFDQIVYNLAKQDNTNTGHKLDDTDERLINRAILGKYQSRILTINGEQYPATHGRRFRVNDEFESWIKQNIHPAVTDAGITFSGGNSSYHGAHTDQSRDYLLHYGIDTGGDNVATVFYQQKGHPIVRKKRWPFDNVVVDDYSELIEIDRVTIPVRRWCLMNADIIHAVENITRTRMSYHIGFNDNIFFDQYQ